MRKGASESGGRTVATKRPGSLFPENGSFIALTVQGLWLLIRQQNLSTRLSRVLTGPNHF